MNYHVMIYLGQYIHAVSAIEGAIFYLNKEAFSVTGLIILIYTIKV